MSAFTFFDLLLVALSIGIAGWTIAVRDDFPAVVGFVAYGLVLSIVWVRLSATDVAMTEAAIGSGLTGVLLLRAVSRQRAKRSEDAAPGNGIRIVAAVLSAIVAAGLAAVVLMPAAPAPNLSEEVAANLPLTGVGNAVTGVLMTFRAMDTFLETVVVLLSLFGVWSLTPDRLWGGRPAEGIAETAPGALVFLGQLLAPAGIVVGIYIVWVGADEPGGKFQGATILAAMWLLALAAGLTDMPSIGSGRLRALLLVGPAMFVAIGFAGFWTAGAFLAFPPPLAKPLIVVIEAALTLSLAVTLGLLVAGPPRRAP